MKLEAKAFLIVITLLLAACGGQTAAPSSPAATPQSNAAAASKPAASSSASAKPAGSAPAAASAPASAAAKPSAAPGETLVPYTAITANMAPLWVGLDNDLFSRFNAKVKTTSVNNGQVAIQALLAGDYHMVLVDGVSMTSAAVNTDTVMVAGILDRFNFSIMTRPDIGSVAQLKGKKIGVTGLGNATGMAAEAMAQKQGWDPQKDIQIIQIQTLPAIVAALKAGQVDAGPLSHPTLTQARAEGMHSVEDLYKENIPFLHTGLVTTKGYLNGHRDEITNVIRGLMAAEAYSKAHGDAFKASITKYTQVSDPAALDETWQVYTNDLYVKKMTLSTPGEQLILDLLGPQNPGVKNIKPEQVLDDSIVSQLDKSGEIDRIYAEFGK